MARQGAVAWVGRRSREIEALLGAQARRVRDRLEPAQPQAARRPEPAHERGAREHLRRLPHWLGIGQGRRLARGARPGAGRSAPGHRACAPVPAACDRGGGSRRVRLGSFCCRRARPLVLGQQRRRPFDRAHHGLARPPDRGILVPEQPVRHHQRRRQHAAQIVPQVRRVSSSSRMRLSRSAPAARRPPSTPARSGQPADAVDQQPGADRGQQRREQERHARARSAPAPRPTRRTPPRRRPADIAASPCSTCARPLCLRARLQ